MSQRSDKPDEAKINEYIERIHYSDRYSDEQYEYRHVILPKPLFKLIPKSYFNDDDSGTLRLLADHEWRGIGIQQSLGWVHYEIHAPEPHVLLFRRPKDYDQQQYIQQQMQMQANGKPVAGKNSKKK